MPGKFLFQLLDNLLASLSLSPGFLGIVTQQITTPSNAISSHNHFLHMQIVRNLPVPPRTREHILVDFVDTVQSGG
jgi:hypothetical protein